MPERYVLRLSNVAEADLAEIYEYGFKRWGERQADLHYAALIAHFDLLCSNPVLFAAVDDIRPGYRRSVCGSHAVYYRVSEFAVEMMAVIGRQDIRHRLGVFLPVKKGGPCEPPFPHTCRVDGLD